jgi:hypothetical protein
MSNLHQKSNTLSHASDLSLSSSKGLSQKLSRPSILIKSGELRNITGDAIQAIEQANIPPVYFVRSGILVRFRVDEQMHPMLETVNDPILIGRLARVADFYTKKGYKQRVPCDPPLRVARDILALGSWSFPRIIGIVEAPILRIDGSILTEPGFDKQTGLYYYPTPGFIMDPVIDNPSQNLIATAKNSLLKIFQDFPFKDQASLVNMLGLLITPFVRPAIDGCVPLALIDAPQAGTGKTMLGRIVSITATGHNPMMLPYSQDREEMRKQITSVLKANANVIVMDNITMELNSNVLASAITTTEWSDRLLSRNEMLMLPQHATWIVNGNNLRIGGDLPRRCYSIQLDAKMSQPWKRSEFHQPDLLDWVERRRAELIWAVLLLVSAWVSAGKPDFSGLKLGGFTEWSNIVGGILEVAGVDGFLSNLDQMYDTADEESSQWEAFLLGLQDHFHQEWFTTFYACEALLDNPILVDALPDELGSPFRFDGEIDHRFKLKLGSELRKRIYTRYGSKQMYIEYQKDSHLKIAKWRVVCGDAGTCGTSTTELENKINIDSKSGEKAPAHPAVPAIPQYNCYACGSNNWQLRPDGSGVFCGICHPVK